MMSRVAQAHTEVEPMGATENVAGPEVYFVDSLFRSDEAVADNKVAVKAEGARIFSNALRQGQMPAADQNYLGHLIAGMTGISQSDANKRISDIFVQAQGMEETARKSSARLLIWLFFALIMGAFSASFAAMIGGKQRDHVKAA
jgi:hypothetical protein